MGEVELTGQGAEQDELVQPCPATAYDLALASMSRARTRCRAGPHVPRHRRHEESYAVGRTAPSSGYLRMYV